MTHPEIQYLQLEHYAGLQALHRACDKEYAVNWVWNPHNTLVALADGKVIGMITAWIDDQPYCFVDNLLVHPEYRGGAVGPYLAIAMGEMLRDRGVKVIRAVVESDTIVRGLVKLGNFRVVDKFTVVERFE